MSWLRPFYTIEDPRRQKGQVMPIAAVIFIVLCGIAGLAIDSSRDYLTKRDAQNAADFSALAAAKQLALSGNLSNSIITGSKPVIAAHDFAANNGFGTIYATNCDSTSGSGFTTTWFDVSGLPCGSATGFRNKVTVRSPAQSIPGAPIPTVCVGSGQYACLQVVITTKVAELFTAVLGINTAYVTVAGTAHATLPGVLYNTPPPEALVLYQPYDNCTGAHAQCFDTTKAAARSSLSCVGGSNNCPTFWTRPNAGVDIYGYDGAFLSPAQDQTTLQSNGAMLIQARSSLCDPYGGATCVHNTVIGAQGFALPNGDPVICQKYGTGATGNSTPCTTTGQSGLQELDAAQASFVPQSYWRPTVDTSQLSDCGGLVLNGGPVYGNCASTQEPYLISPGIYDYIVINHGTYEFDQGLYDVTGSAPVNTNTGAGYTANGIDHSRETASDFDLCTGGQPNSCQNLTAGVWIGHGAGTFGAYVAPTSGSCVGSGSGGSSGGGGDNTIISGSGVVFRLENSSGGFVSTTEVAGLELSGAGVGALPSIGGSPLLFDNESSNFVHLDANPANTNGIQGVLYQTPDAVSGGFEMDFSLAQSPTAALYGQILAYSFTTFGGSGIFDFRDGYGAGSVGGIATSGKNETSLISKVTLVAGAPGMSVLTVSYTDEWSLDGYNAYVKVNNGNPTFFSQGIWNPQPAAGDPLPPFSNNPGDQYPAYPNSSASGPYIVASGTDWTYNIPNSGGASFELKGNWTWGHQSDISGAASGSYVASAIYTFPTPVGNFLAITVFVTDGDHCGDYALASYTFKNVGGPSGGTQTVGTVQLVQ
jgi:Flp pilus assembly protein TadG